MRRCNDCYIANNFLNSYSKRVRRNKGVSWVFNTTRKILLQHLS